MNKGELVDLLEQRLGSRRAASDAMESVLDAVVRAVARGERVAISGFGTFERADRAPRTGRNPRTGETVPIAGTSVPRFKPGTAFRAFVAEPGSLPEPGQEDPSAGGALRAATTRRGGVELSDRPTASPRTTADAADGAGSAPAAVGAVGDAPQAAEDEKPAKGSKAKKKDAEPAKKPKAAKETKDPKDGKKAKGKKK